MKKYCYANGKINLLAKSGVALNDLGILRGYGVFDFLKTVNGKPFLWSEHWKRFVNSAKLLNLKVPVGESVARKIISELLKKNKCADASIRLLLTGGATEDGMSIKRPNFFILAEDVYQYPPEFFEKGIKVITHEHQREISGAKNINYLTPVSLHKKKQEAGATEILYIYRGRVLECSTSNFFIVKKGKIYTADKDVLSGTIRNKVIELARAAGLKVIEKEIKVKDLWTADETFLTATNKNVTPVVQIDERKIAGGEVGPVTKQVMALLRDYMTGY